MPPRTANANHDRGPNGELQLDLFTVKQAVAQAVAHAFDREHHTTKRTADPRRKLQKYPENMRVDQVAAYLNCDEKHIRNLIEEGALDAKDISSAGATKRCLRIPRDSVAQYDERTKAKATHSL